MELRRRQPQHLTFLAGDVLVDEVRGDAVGNENGYGELAPLVAAHTVGTIDADDCVDEPCDDIIL